MLDTDYDGRCLYPNQIFLPLANKKEGWYKLAQSIKANIDVKNLDYFHGVVSLPFEVGDYKRIAVNIVDNRGISSLRVIDIEENAN